MPASARRANPNRAELLAPIVRWRPEAKARLLTGIQNGLITMADARQAHGLSTDELEGWWKAWRRDGINALRVTRDDRRRA